VEAARVSLLVAIAKGKLVLVSDPLDAATYRTSYLRRGIGVLVCGAPVLLLVASMVSVVIAGDRPNAIGSIAMVVAIAIAALNFYLSAVRGLVFRRRNGSLDGYQHISGIPGIGSLVVVAGAVVGFGSGLCVALGLIAIGLDVSGSVWFLVATWRDSSLWDRPRRA
jgi:hypothetical protein